MHTQKLQSLGQLAGGVAHDFNNILSIIEGYARILERQFGPTHDANEKLQHILAATKRGAGLTRRLLAFGRQDILSGKICDLTQTVRESEALLKPLLSERIQLEISLPAHSLYVPCDADVISQILLNLATNARDAIQDSGNVWIRVTADSASRASLSVIDNGCGIPEDILTRIFEPFFTTKPQGQGTGLGLSMIAGLMQQMQGSIDVESIAGHGTKFLLNFPRTSAPALPLKESHRQDTSLKQKTILVVDDEEALLPVLQLQLQELGMKVLQAANAERALVVQEDYQEPIDLLLTDVVMPGMNGAKLAELFTSLRPETGVVFMTGYPNRGTAIGHASPLPQDALVVPKPLSPDELSPALEKALRLVRTMPKEDTHG